MVLQCNSSSVTPTPSQAAGSSLQHELDKLGLVDYLELFEQEEVGLTYCLLPLTATPAHFLLPLLTPCRMLALLYLLAAHCALLHCWLSCW